MINPAQPDERSGHEARAAVLVVDDEAPLLQVFSEALSMQFEVTHASSSAEALAALSERKFKVVIADHLMPGGNGLDLLVRIKDVYPHTQRILVTGFMKPDMLLRGMNEAALFRYLLKPLRMAELVNAAEAAVKVHDALAASTAITPT